MNNLILVRHGQSHWNKERRFTGWADIDLTDKGKEEARLAGELIKKTDIKFDAFEKFIHKNFIFGGGISRL